MPPATFPAKDDPQLRYYKGPRLGVAVVFALLTLIFLIAFLVVATQEEPRASAFGLFILWVGFGYVAWSSYRQKAAATELCIYIQPVFGSVRAIEVARISGYALSNGRYGSTVILLSGRQRLASLPCTPGLINYLGDRSLRAQKDPESIF